MTGEHEGLGLGGHGCDLDAKGRGNTLIPDHIAFTIRGEFRASQMITVQEDDVALIGYAARATVITSGVQEVILMSKITIPKNPNIIIA